MRTRHWYTCFGFWNGWNTLICTLEDIPRTGQTWKFNSGVWSLKFIRDTFFNEVLKSSPGAGFTMTERTPLLHYRLSTSVNESELRSQAGRQAPVHNPGSQGRRAAQQKQQKKLSTFFGVVIPTLLSMFSVVVFLRIGECSFRRTCANHLFGKSDAKLFRDF